MRALLVVLALGSCKKEPVDSATEPDPCDGLAVTWESFGSGFFATWCTGCHSTALVGPARFGAPPGTDFDTLEQVRALAPRIDVTVLGNPGFMPPGGGVREEDWLLLEEWLVCGAPGDGGPAAGCVAAAEVAGGTVNEAGAAGFCADGPVRVTGDLAVTGETVVDCLCAVEGELSVDGSLEAAALGTIGALRVVGDVELPALEAVSGDLTVSEAGDLALPFLRSVGGAFAITDSPAMTALALPRLGTVGGGFTVRGTGLLDLDDTRALDTIGGALDVRENDGIAELRVARFARSIGGVAIAGNAALTRLESLELAKATGDVSVADNPLLRQLVGFDSLETLDGSLAIERNGVLEQVTGAFVRLETIEGDLLIRDNPGLSSGEVEGLVQRATVGGATTVAGNGP